MTKKHIILFTSALTAALLGGCIAPETEQNAKPTEKPAAGPTVKTAAKPAAKNIFTQADQLRMKRKAEQTAAAEQARKKAQEDAKKGIKPAPAPKPDPVKQKYQAELEKKFLQAAALARQNRIEESDKLLDAIDADKLASDTLRGKSVSLRACNLFRQKKYDAVIAYTDAMAKKNLSDGVQIALLEQKANALKELKKFDAQMTVLLEWLSANITNAQAFQLKRRIVFSLESAGKTGDAFAALRTMEQEPALTDREKLQLMDDAFRIADRAGDFAVMKAECARIAAATQDPAKEVQYTLLLADAYARAKQAGEADRIRKAVINDPAKPMSLRINAFFAIANPIRSNEWASKRRIFYELGNTLLKDSKHNPWKGKPAFENASDEIQMRKTENLEWIVDAIRELELSGANKLTLCRYLSDIAKRYVDEGELANKLSQMILETPEANPDQQLAAIRTLYDSALDRKQYAAADKFADRAIAVKGLRKDQYAAVCAMKARVLAVQEKCDEAAAYLRRQLADPERKSIQMYRELANLYAYFFRTEDTVKVYLEAGEIQSAIRTLAARWPDRAADMAEKYLNDPAQPESIRVFCMGYFLNSTPKAKELRGKYPQLLEKLGSSRFYDCARMAATNGDYRLADEMLDLIARGGSRDFNRDEYMKISFSTYAGLNDAKKIHAFAEACAAAKGVGGDILRTVKFIDGAFALPQKAGAFRKYYDSFAFDKDATARKRSDLLLYAGQLMMNARRFEMADEAYKTYRSLYKPEPKKIYEIHFSDTPVNGMEGFLRLAKQPEKQLMDRKFGGNMDFLVTDVSTGERAAGIGSDKKAQVKPTEMQIVCDEYGVHFLFTAYDDKAQEVQAGLGSAGSYEMYLAPGINQPYFCFLPNLNTGINHIWNTTYDNAQWHRLDPGFKKKDVKTDHLFTKDGYRFYMFLNWEKFYDKLPETGDLWEYENVHWSRFGGYSWNGLKTIHGRSTWGHLKFNISKKQSVKIKRHIIYEARKAYQQEKNTTGNNHGVIDRWQNDAVLGDPEFFQQKVAPVRQKLDDALKLVKVDMDDETVEKLYREAVPGWFRIKYIISDLRRQYLEEKLSE